MRPLLARKAPSGAMRGELQITSKIVARTAVQAPPSVRGLSPVVVMETTTTLFIARDGRIACRDDCPPPGSDAYYLDDYRPLTKSEATALERALGKPVECHGCMMSRMHREAR